MFVLAYVLFVPLTFCSDYFFQLYISLCLLDAIYLVPKYTLP